MKRILVVLALAVVVNAFAADKFLLLNVSKPKNVGHLIVDGQTFTGDYYTTIKKAHTAVLVKDRKLTRHVKYTNSNGLITQEIIECCGTGSGCNNAIGSFL